MDRALASGAVFTGDGWNYIAESFPTGTLHFIGLLSDGGVHSRTDQLFALIRGAAERGAKRIRVHVLTDGRDVPDGTSLKFVGELEAVLKSLPAGVDGRIASGGGRMFVTMDRYEADWHIVERGWRAHVLGDAPHAYPDATAAVTALRANEGGDKVTDQWLPPFVIVDDAGKPVGPVVDGDAVVIFNFRADRCVEISKAFEYESGFDHFDRVRFPKTRFVGLMQYDGDLKLPARYLVAPPAITNTSGELLAKAGVTTFACSETQKFGHVTFFWNGNRSGYFDEGLETYAEIPSDNVPFNQAPAMKALEITEAGKAALASGKYKMVRINYANPDMVGHTGDLAATISCVELVDRCLGELLAAADAVGARWLVTADHGNADDMVQRAKKTNAPLQAPDGTNLPLTSHTLAPVPVAVGGAGLPAGVAFRGDLPDAGLANVTGTFLNLLGYATPAGYEPSLI